MKHRTFHTYPPKVRQILLELLEEDIPHRHMSKQLIHHLRHKAYMRHSMKLRIQHIHPDTFVMSPIYTIYVPYDNNSNWYKDLLQDLDASELYAVAKNGTSESVKDMKREQLAGVHIVYCVSRTQPKPKRYHEKETIRHIYEYFASCIKYLMKTLHQFLSEFPEYVDTLSYMRYWMLCTKLYAKMIASETMQKEYHVKTMEEFLARYLHRDVSSATWKSLFYKSVCVPFFAALCKARPYLLEYEQAQMQREMRLGYQTFAGLTKDQYVNFWKLHLTQIGSNILKNMDSKMLSMHLLHSNSSFMNARDWCKRVLSGVFDHPTTTEFTKPGPYVRAFDYKFTPIPYVLIFQPQVVPTREVLQQALREPIPILLYADVDTFSGVVKETRLKWKEYEGTIEKEKISIGFRGNDLVYRFTLDAGMTVTMDPVTMAVRITSANKRNPELAGVAHEKIIKGGIREITIKLDE